MLIIVIIQLQVYEIYFEENAPNASSLLLLSFLVSICDRLYYNISELKRHNHDPYEMILRKEPGRKTRKPKESSPDYDVILNRNGWANKKLIQILRNY